MTSQSTTEQTYIAATNALPPELGSRVPAAPAWLFPLVFWVYTALSILWLAIGLLPGLLPMASLPYRQVLDAAPDVRWLRNLWLGFYIASLRAEPLAAVLIQYLFSFLNIALAIVLYRSRPRDRVARLLALGMVGTAAIFNYQAHSSLELMGPFVNTVHEFLHVFSGSMYLIALLIFPDGKLPPWPGRRWRPPAVAGQAFGPLAIFGLLLFGYMLTIVLHGEPASFVAFYGVVIPVVGIAAQTFRYRSGTGQQRQLSKTLILALTLSLALASALGLVAWLASSEPLALSWQTKDTLNRLAFVVFPLLFAMLPLSLTAIVLRYRLWEIDFIINRSLVYGGLTALVILLYALGVGALGIFVGTQYGVAVAVATTIVVAVLFQPLRAWLQQGVNRLMYGERDDPVAVLTRLGKRLEATMAPDAVLPTVAETVAQALRLPYVGIAVKDGDDFEVLAEYPVKVAPWLENTGARQDLATRPPLRPDSRPSAPTVSFPLTSQGLVVGKLIVASRAPGQSFTAADRRLLASIAQRAGAAIEIVQLTADLQRSRERLVLAREEERRRLRRDLHDGLGPQLATLTLELDAALNVLSSDPDRASRMLKEIRAQTQTAIGDIRRLVYDLRPPALDQLGLVGALQEHGARSTGNDLDVQVRVPADLQPLPAAVEVAAYRIATEALTNVLRHAQARHCTIWLCLADALYLAVDDDGGGLPDGYRPGVGMASMCERAEELGGGCRIERRAEGGTRLIARLPVSDLGASDVPIPVL